MIRIASYNLQKCVGLDLRRRPDRILRVIGALAAQVVVLQEADKRLAPRMAALPHEMAEAEAAMQAVHPDTRIELRRKFRVPGLQPEEGGAAERLARQITGDNGSHVVSYGTEAGQFQERGYSAVICGPGDIAQAHQPDEFITVAQFEAGHAFMQDLVARLRGA